MTNNKGIFIKNIYYMLSYAFHHLNELQPEKIQTENFESVWDLMAEILSNCLKKQVKRGLSKEYVNLTQELSTIKGKLLFNESIKNLSSKKLKLTCNFHEYSVNTIFNQILKSTAIILIKSKKVKDDKKKALKKSLLYFNNVSVIDLKKVQWNSFQYNRYNSSYRFILVICSLIVKSLILTTEKGEYELMSFFDDQNFHHLYEKFLLEYFKQKYPFLNPSASHIEWQVSQASRLDLLPQMKSDITLHDKKSGKTLIIDAKFYGKIMQIRFDKQTYHSNNIYQIFTYVKNKDVASSGNVSGMLLYAKTSESEIPEVSSYNMSGNKISINVLDLNCEFKEIENQLKNIISEYFNI